LSSQRFSLRSVALSKPCDPHFFSAHAIFARSVSESNLNPKTALTILTALNLLNYVDRNVLYAVQPLVQDEFHINKAQVGYLTSAFLLCYMIAAPFVGPLADRYSRKLIIVIGAIFWSGLTLLTAVTHTYTELLVRHTLVGVGEATFVTIAPTFVADLFAENKRGRILGVFYLAIPVGSAAGYLLGGHLAPQHGWRFPFYIAAAPGFVLALMVLFLKEPERGQFDSLEETPERGTILGLARNPAFLTAALGMAAMTFSLGGIQVWMPQFLYSERHYSLQKANLIFGIIVVVDGILASLAGGWLGDYLLPRMKSSYYFVSAVGMALGVPFMIVALFVQGPLMLPAIGVAAFFLLLNTSPLNAAIMNSVGAHIRATAIAVGIFIYHLLGDVPSPTMMGWVADRHSLQTAFVLPVIAMIVSAAILFYGMRFAPPVATDSKPAQAHAG
jgi:MFS transporter, Spinster family, sphingosine-1-phosphate transporter